MVSTLYWRFVEAFVDIFGETWMIYSLFFSAVAPYTLDSCGMRKKTAEFQSFFIVIAFVLMTSNVIKSFVQRRNVRHLFLSCGSLQLQPRVSSHTYVS